MLWESPLLLHSCPGACWSLRIKHMLILIKRIKILWHSVLKSLRNNLEMSLVGDYAMWIIAFAQYIISYSEKFDLLKS